jgi:hypothetical protein
LIALVSLIATVPKFRVAADRVIGAMPVPVSATFCVPPASLTMVRLAAEIAPSAGGVRVRPITQLLLAASVVPQAVPVFGAATA